MSKPIKMPRRKRLSAKEMVGAGDAKTMILLGANVLAGIFDCIAEVEKGTPKIHAATRAMKRGKARAKAIVDAEQRVVSREATETIVDAEFVEDEES